MSGDAPRHRYVKPMWIGLNLLGFGVAGAVFGALQRAHSQRYYEVVTDALVAVRIETLDVTRSLAAFGAVVGTAQWLALRRASFVRWWVVATTLGWALAGSMVGLTSGLALGSISNIGPHRPPAVALAGVFVATTAVAIVPSGAQWLILRRHVTAANRWPLVTLASLILGVTVGGIVVRWFLVEVVPWLTPYDFPSAKALVTVGAIVGVVYGTVTASWVDRHLLGHVDASASVGDNRAARNAG